MNIENMDDSYFVYIIYSPISDKYYIGSTSNIEERIIKHNQKHAGFTGKQSDWELKYFEKFNSKADAIKREFQIKKWKSRVMIEKLICNS